MRTQMSAGGSGLVSNLRGCFGAFVLVSVSGAGATPIEGAAAAATGAVEAGALAVTGAGDTLLMGVLFSRLAQPVIAKDSTVRLVH